MRSSASSTAARTADATRVKLACWAPTIDARTEAQTFPATGSATLRSISFLFSASSAGPTSASVRAADPASERPKERTKEERADVEGLAVVAVAVAAAAAFFGAAAGFPLAAAAAERARVT